MRQPYVEDKSSNGTWLNGERLQQGAQAREPPRRKARP